MGPLKIFILLALLSGCSTTQKKEVNEMHKSLEKGFVQPPDSVRSWVLWDWINGNVSREGITKDLESMKEVGVGGVVWRGLAGPWWAPKGKNPPYSIEWHDHMQWAIQEAERLGIRVTLSVDFGYGSGGPHITPDNSMQKLLWSSAVITGGAEQKIELKRPDISREEVENAWLRPEEKLNEKVLNDINQTDSYRDIAVWAMPLSEGKKFQIPQLALRTGLGDKTWFMGMKALSPPEGAVVPGDQVIELTGLLEPDGTLTWDVPPGKWEIIRLGHASNYKMTRPSPAGAVGLECDRLSTKGIDAHFEAFLKPILENAGSMAGKTLDFVFLDSWEARTQNWTADMPEEFRERNGYDLAPWLPVLTGSVIESPEHSERFLWDFRRTVSEMTLDHYHQRLKKLLEPYGIRFTVEAYGNLCVDNLKYAELSAFPVSEFWTRGEERFPELGNHFRLKTMASVAHALGLPRVGAEAFTGARGWDDHPFLIKGMGDEAYCQGINQFILHLSAHQAYDHMVPGLTHRKWGGHFNRHNTWWSFSRPWFQYQARCQYMLQQGHFVADVCYFFGEGAPLNVRDMDLRLPAGYDYDFCSATVLQQMDVRDGQLILPSGMTYRYLLLPDHDRLTLQTMKKIKELAEAGAKIVAQREVTGTPGLSDYPQADSQVKQLADQLWDKGLILTEPEWETIFKKDEVNPDFVGKGLHYLHRKTEVADIYFVANTRPDPAETNCSFRISGKIPELWDPETGEMRELPDYEISEGQISIPMRFDPMQSWFIVFRKSKSRDARGDKNFPELNPVRDVNGPWEVRFDPQWGGPEDPVRFETLEDWSKSADPAIKYYSGTAEYRSNFELPTSLVSSSGRFLIDLGKTEVMARVWVNGKNCGVAWKAPYRADITDALKEGENALVIEVVNTWVNRMIGDEQLPQDCEWINWETLKEWPEWFLKNEPRPSGRYTFTTANHYEKDDPPVPSGLLGPVRILEERLD